jgi:very-short-patch-repair endonuclease
MPNPSNNATRSRRRSGATDRARALRKGDNLAEGRLWIELQDRRLGGFKFVRQLPIGPYFADFACREHRLVVELDGSQHAGSEHDRRRDDFMNNAGYSVLRFWSHEVRSQTASVCETILAALTGRLAERTVASDLRYFPAKLGSNGRSFSLRPVRATGIESGDEFAVPQNSTRKHSPFIPAT